MSKENVKSIHNVIRLLKKMLFLPINRINRRCTARHSIFNFPLSLSHTLTLTLTLSLITPTGQIYSHHIALEPASEDEDEDEDEGEALVLARLHCNALAYRNATSLSCTRYCTR